MTNLLVSVIWLLVGLFFVVVTAVLLRLRILYGVALYFYHLAYLVAYYYYTKNAHADALDYYYIYSNNGYSFGPGTAFISSLLYFFKDNLSISYFDSFQLFGLFGTLGMLFLLVFLLRSGVAAYASIIILLLPGFSFWSVAIGKDSLMLFASCGLLFSVFKNKYLISFLCMLLMFYIRPHIGMLAIISLLMALVVARKVNISLFFLGASLVLLAVINMDYVLNFVGLYELSFDGIENVYQRSQLSSVGGGAVALQDYNFAVRLFAYIFRPFIWEAKSFLQFVAAIEVVIIFIVFVYLIYLQRSFVSRDSVLFYFSLIYSSSFLLLNSFFMSNLGIVVRQKYSIIPFLFVVFLSRNVVQSKAFRLPDPKRYPLKQNN